MPAAPAPTMTASTQPERGTSGAGARRCKRGRGRQDRGGGGKEGSAAQTSHGAQGVKRCEVYHGTRVPRVGNLVSSSHACGIATAMPYSRPAPNGAGNQGRETTMIDAAVKARAQMFAPPFRWVLLKSAGLALFLIVLIAIGLHRLLLWLATTGANWAETVFGVSAHAPLSILIWIVSIAAGLGIIVGSVFLMPAVTALVGSFFVDDIALEVERTHYPAEPVG